MTHGVNAPTSSERYAGDLELAVLGRNRTPSERAMGDPGRAVRSYADWQDILDRFDSGAWRRAGAVVCTDCLNFPFIDVVDTERHDALHIELAARFDPSQAGLFR